MKSLLREYFSFSSSERRGILVLIFLLLTVIISPEFISGSEKKFDINKYDDEIQTFINASNSSEFSDQQLGFEGDLFEFDPNTLNKEGWMALGLTEKQFETLDNYRNKGGKFYRNEDLEKIYGFPKDLFNILEPYIKIRNNKKQYYKKPKHFSKYPKYSNNFTNNEKVKNIVLDLNTTDSIDLVQIRGIGPAFARRIIKYREKLGGFIYIDQLKEVYGIDDTKFEQIKDNFVIDSTIVTMISLNKSTFKDLIKHPYLNKESVRRILKYKEIMGTIKTPQGLLLDEIIDSATYYKILPYLTID
jgi:competence protein ComEA